MKDIMLNNSEDFALSIIKDHLNNTKLRRPVISFAIKKSLCRNNSTFCEVLPIQDKTFNGQFYLWCYKRERIDGKKEIVVEIIRTKSLKTVKRFRFPVLAAPACPKTIGILSDHSLRSAVFVNSNLVAFATSSGKIILRSFRGTSFHREIRPSDWVESLSYKNGLLAALTYSVRSREVINVYKVNNLMQKHLLPEPCSSIATYSFLGRAVQISFNHNGQQIVIQGVLNLDKERIYKNLEWVGVTGENINLGSLYISEDSRLTLEKSNYSDDGKSLIGYSDEIILLNGEHENLKKFPLPEAIRGDNFDGAWSSHHNNRLFKPLCDWSYERGQLALNISPAGNTVTALRRGKLFSLDLSNGCFKPQPCVGAVLTSLFLNERECLCVIRKKQTFDIIIVDNDFKIKRKMSDTWKIRPVAEHCLEVGVNESLLISDYDEGYLINPSFNEPKKFKYHFGGVENVVPTESRENEFVLIHYNKMASILGTNGIAPALGVNEKPIEFQRNPLGFNLEKMDKRPSIKFSEHSVKETVNLDNFFQICLEVENTDSVEVFCSSKFYARAKTGFNIISMCGLNGNCCVFLQKKQLVFYIPQNKAMLPVNHEMVDPSKIFSFRPNELLIICSESIAMFKLNDDLTIAEKKILPFEQILNIRFSFAKGIFFLVENHSVLAVSCDLSTKLYRIFLSSKGLIYHVFYPEELQKENDYHPGFIGGPAFQELPGYFEIKKDEKIMTDSEARSFLTEQGYCLPVNCLIDAIKDYKAFKNTFKNERKIRELKLLPGFFHEKV